MHIEVTNHAFAFAEVHMESGDSVYAAPGSMATMRGAVDVGASFGGGNALKAMFRRYADQTSIMAKYAAKGPALLGLAPEDPGDIAVLDLSRTGPLRIEAGALLAYESTVDIATRVTNVRKMLMSNSAVGLRATGEGKVLVSTFGAMQSTSLAAGERMIVDSGHIVAWSDAMKMKFGPLGGVAKSGLVGEGFVGQFEGPGTVLVQTRQRGHMKKRNRR